MRTVIKFMSKTDADMLFNGQYGRFTFYNEYQLHHIFGDHPEEHVVQVEITQYEKLKLEKP